MPSMKFATTILAAVCLAACANAAPAGTSSALEASPTTPYASENSNQILWTENEELVPQPIRNGLGATILGPQNVQTDLQNADLLAPPSTDSGTVYVLRLPKYRKLFSLVRLAQWQCQVAIQFESQPSPEWRLGTTTKW